MGAIEKPMVGPRDGHSNGKALFALALGFFAMANVTVFAVLFVVDVDALDRAGPWWLLLPFFGLGAGSAAALIGSISWIDVRRGITDQRLFEAKFGTFLGGIAAGAVTLAIIVLFLMILFLVFTIPAGMD